jgi:hypothetical protein
MVMASRWAALRACLVLGSAAGAGLVAVPAQAAPLSLTLEARAGPYVPDLDPYRGANALDTSAGVSGFSCEFGFGVRPSFWVSPQLSVFDLFGTVTLGVEAGFYNIRARKLFDPSNCSSGTRGLSTEELTVLPVMATATYRFDWALDRFRIPVVPYVRAGFGGAGFLITENGKPANSVTQQVYDQNGDPIFKDGSPVLTRRDPAGFSLGGKLAVGMMLALDFLEPLRALRARAKNVYNHTFFFVEVAGFDAGMYQNALLALSAQTLTDAGIPFYQYLGPTLVVGSERLPLITGGFAITF